MALAARRRTRSGDRRAARRARPLDRGHGAPARPRGLRRARERRPDERAPPLLPRRPRARREEPRRARPDRPIDVLSHPALARLHPTGQHPERRERLAALLQRFPDYREGRVATDDELELCHRPEVVEPTWLDYDTLATETTYDAAALAAGTAIEAALSGGFALVRPPGHHALPE